MAAQLEVGWGRFLDFAVACGALGERDRAGIADRVRGALLAGAAAQAEHQRELNPVQRFADGLRSALVAGEVHVSTLDDDVPDDPGVWGWRKRLVGVGADLEERWEPRGARVGWLDGGNLYVLPEAAYKAAAAQHRDGLGIGQATLGRRLQDAGLLLTVNTEKDGRIHCAVKAPRAIPNRPRVLHLRPSLSAGPVGPAGPTAFGSGSVSSSRSLRPDPSGPTAGSEVGPGLTDNGVRPGALPNSKSRLSALGGGTGPSGPAGPTGNREEERQPSDDDAEADVW
jgi:hypothetical protein